MIFENVDRFLEWRDDCEDILGIKRDIWLTCGGFDPLHVGHLRCIQDTARMARDSKRYPRAKKGLVVIVVNDDNFLHAKKGYAFMKLQDRMEIINAIEGVDAVLPWFYENHDFTIVGALKKIRPKYFTKGGDRTDVSNIPEWDTCKEIKCEIITQVGGNKIRSSSDLVERSDRLNLEVTELMGWSIGYSDGRNDR
tara:strand:- start:81 stop:665 length:585 start_codon:yes stop_codon:yes gene_type:complete